MTKNEIKNEITKGDVKYLQLQFVDLDGHLHTIGKTISELEAVMANRVMIDGSSIKGFATIDSSDLFLAPDWTTFIILPNMSNIASSTMARVICAIVDCHGKPFGGCVRNALQKVERKYAKDGIALAAAFEAEFFLLRRDEQNGALQPVDCVGYLVTTPLDKSADIRHEIGDTLVACGLKVETLHKEVAAGQHEINCRYSSAVAAADGIITLKWIVQTVAARHGLVATFMPKPFFGTNGSGMHTNISIFRDSNNMFWRDEASEINETQKRFISGLVNRAKEMTLFTNPTVNSYKRLIPGFEAPNCIAWSASNRSAMLRIPASIGEATRIEQRNVDATANPYLVLALIFEAGLEGMRNEVGIVKPIKENLFAKTVKEIQAMGINFLPTSLHEALDIARKSSFANRVLGGHIFDHFISLRNNDWDEYSKSISFWEIDKYINW